MKEIDWQVRAIQGVLLALSCIFLYLFFFGADWLMPWSVTTTADSHSFETAAFWKGPFRFSFEAVRYSLAEAFTAGPITGHPIASTLCTVLILIGLNGLLTFATTLPRFWFLAICGAFIFFVLNLHLEEVGLFGMSNTHRVSSVILMSAYLIPAYLFHGFFPSTSMAKRMLAFLILTSIVVISSYDHMDTLHAQFTTGSHFSLAIVSLLLLFAVAEAPVFAILYAVTLGKGAKNNGLHLAMFCLSYLALWAIYYAKRYGHISFGFSWVEPYPIFFITLILGAWVLFHRRYQYQSFINISTARAIYIFASLICFGWLLQGLVTGNDPVYRGFEYLILYAHLGFGTIFLLYIIVNFVTPLSQGMPVYKIAYKDHTFPFLSARLAGLAAVAGMYFLASAEPLRLLQAGFFNYQGLQAEQALDQGLAQEYYTEGAIYGADNHFSNYKLGFAQLTKGNIDQANGRFKRATVRFPTPQAFAQTSGTYALMNSSSAPTMVSLQDGLREFDSHYMLKNNLGLTYLAQGKDELAAHTFRSMSPTNSWKSIHAVNYWKTNPSSPQMPQDYQNLGIGVKANILNNALSSSTKGTYAIDTTNLQRAPSLHRMAYLINSCYLAPESGAPDLILHRYLTGTLGDDMYFNAQLAVGLAKFLAGRVNDAMIALDRLRAESTEKKSARAAYFMGLIALHEGASQLALDYLDRAIAGQNAEAPIAKLSALMEHDFSAARLYAKELNKQQGPGYASLGDDLAQMQAASPMDSAYGLSHVYYFHNRYSPSTLQQLLPDAPQEWRASLWDKILNTYYLEDGKLRQYYELFASYLAPDQQLLFQQVFSAAVDLETAASLAKANALNEPIQVRMIQRVLKEDTLQAYDLLVLATNINQKSDRLLKMYIETALYSGLTSYAEEALTRLEKLVPPDEYSSFRSEFSLKKEAYELRTGW